MKSDAYIRWLERDRSENPLLEIACSILLWCIFFAIFVALTYFCLETGHSLCAAVTGLAVMWCLPAVSYWTGLLISMIAYAERK